MNPYVCGEFVRTIGAAGAYANETAFLAGVACDISANDTQVFGLTSASAVFHVGETITGGTSGFHGHVVDATTTQVLVTGVSGTPIPYETVTGGTSTHYATITDRGRLANLVGEWIDAVAGGVTAIAPPAGLVTGRVDTIRPIRFVVFRPAEGFQATGKWDATRKRFAGVVTITIPYCRFEGVGISSATGGIVVNAGTPTTSLVVVGSCIVAGPTTKTGNPNGIGVTSGKVLVAGCGIYEWQNAAGIYATGANSEVHVYQNTLYHNQYGLQGASSATIYVDSNIIAQSTYPMVNVSENDNNVTAGNAATYGFSIPNGYGDGLTYDLHSGAAVLSLTDPTVAVYMKASGISDATNGVGYYHPRDFNYRVRPQRPPVYSPTTGPADIGADDYHVSYTPSGAGVELLTTAGQSAKKIRLTANKTASGTAFVVQGPDCWVSLGGKTVTYANAWASSAYSTLPLLASPYSTDTLYVASGGDGCILKTTISTGGVISAPTRIGTEGSGQAQLLCPSDVVRVGTHLYICDLGHQRIVKLLEADGTFVAEYTFAAVDDPADVRPFGITTNGVDRIYVSDNNNPYIYVFNLALAVQARWNVSALGFGSEGSPDAFGSPSPPPEYVRGIRFQTEAAVNYIYAIGRDATRKLQLAADAFPTTVWTVSTGGWSIAPMASWVACRACSEDGPSSTTTLRHLTSGVQIAAHDVAGSGTQGAFGYGVAYQNGHLVLTHSNPDFNYGITGEPFSLLQTLTYASTVFTPIATALYHGSVSGFFCAHRMYWTHRWHACDSTFDSTDRTRIGIYDGTITKAAGAGYATGIFSNSCVQSSFTDLTFNTRGHSSLSMLHMNGATTRAARNKIISTSRPFSCEDRIRHKKWGDISFPEGGSLHDDVTIQDNELFGGATDGIECFYGSRVLISRNFVNLNNWAYAHRATMTNAHAIQCEASGAIITLNEVSNRGGSMFGGYGATGSTFQYNRGAGCGRSTTERYSVHGLWAYTGNQQLSDNCEYLGFHRYPSDKWLAPLYISGYTAQARTSMIFHDNTAYARRNGQSYMGLAAARIYWTPAGSEWLVDGCTLDSDGSIVGIYGYDGPCYGITFRDCTFNQRDGQYPGSTEARWRHTFQIERLGNHGGDIAFEDVTHTGFSNPEDVATNGVSYPNPITLRHSNHLKVTVTDTGAPVLGAAVTVTDNAGTVVATGTTAADGTCIPTNPNDQNAHLHVVTWSSANNGTFTRSYPFRVYASKATKSGDRSITLLNGPDETVAIAITVGGGATPAPVVDRCTPASGTIAGGTDVTITGTGFVDGPPDSTVTFGGVAATFVVLTGATSIACKTPAHAQGSVSVSVTNPDGLVGTLPLGYTYQGDVVLPTTDYSDHFTGGAGAISADWTIIPSGAFTILKDATTNAYSTGNTAGPVMAFYNAAGVANDQFSTITYNITGSPVDTGSVAVWARASGATWNVDLLGYYTVWNPSFGMLTTWAKTAGGATYIPGLSNLALTGRPGAGTLTLECEGTTLRVTLVDANGTYALAGTDATYAAGAPGFGFDLSSGGHSVSTLINIVDIGGVDVEAPPTLDVTSLAPVTGGTSGGDAITIVGTGFAPGARAFFGALESPTVTYVSPTELTATSPTAPGPMACDVRVMNADNVFDEGQDDIYTYVSDPTVVSLSQVQGSTLGGSLITITGTEFFVGATVWFGTTPSLPTVISRTQLTCSTPAHAAGVIGVTVTNIDGGTATLATSFTYVSPPPGAPGDAPNPPSDPGQGKLNIYFGGVATLTLPTKALRSAVSRGNVAAIQNLQWVNAIEQTKLAQVTKPREDTK